MYLGTSLRAQSFEVLNLEDSYRGVIGETIKVPVRFKSNSEKPIILIIRKISSQIGTTQKNYFCIDNNCLDARTEDYVLKVDPNQTLNSMQVALDAGLAQGASAVKYLAFNKANPSEAFEFEINFLVTEHAEKETIYSSEFVTLRDIYPNPIIDNAFLEYKILKENIKAKIILHNILGSAVEEYPLLASENKLKIKAETLNAGIYFYTLYVENEGVITRKLIVKK
jgi:hypothetical protein